MIAHQTKAQYSQIKSKQGDCDIVHPCNKVFPALEDVISLKASTADVIVTFLHFSFEGTDYSWYLKNFR
mgnify:CR=1 FL=1